MPQLASNKETARSSPTAYSHLIGSFPTRFYSMPTMPPSLVRLAFSPPPRGSIQAPGLQNLAAILRSLGSGTKTIKQMVAAPEMGRYRDSTA